MRMMRSGYGGLAILARLNADRVLVATMLGLALTAAGGLVHL